MNIEEIANYYDKSIEKPVYFYDGFHEEFPLGLYDQSDRFTPGPNWNRAVPPSDFDFIDDDDDLGDFNFEFFDSEESNMIEVNSIVNIGDLVPIDELIKVEYIDDVLEEDFEIRDWLKKQPIFGSVGFIDEISTAELLADYIKQYYYRAPLFSNMTPVNLGDKFVKDDETFRVGTIAYKENGENGDRCLVYDKSIYSAVDFPVNKKYLRSDEFVRMSVKDEWKILNEQIAWSTQKYAKLILEIPDRNHLTDDQIEVMVRMDILRRYKELSDNGIANTPDLPEEDQEAISSL